MKGRSIFWSILFLLIIGFLFYLAVKPVKNPEPQIIQKNMNVDLLQTQTTHIATFDTNYGPIVISLYGKLVPKTVDNFVKLSQGNFYDDTRFHRVINDFMIQGGDPNTKAGQNKESVSAGRWGTGGPGYQFADEFSPQLVNSRGTISMANSGPNTNGSQFFINLVDNNHLNNKHSVFGLVTEGMDVVDKIGETETDYDDKPINDVIINSISIKEI